MATTKTRKASATKKMTATEATQFDTYSVTNAATVETSFEDCGCEAYIDCFTYNRWKALGYQVQGGQHGVKIPAIKNIEKQTDDGTVETRRLFRYVVVFCRHQVEPVKSPIPSDRPIGELLADLGV